MRSSDQRRHQHQSVILCATALLVSLASGLEGQTDHQPKVSPGPGEPDWKVVLAERYGLSMFGDLRNPVVTTASATPGLFHKARPALYKHAGDCAWADDTQSRRLVSACRGRRRATEVGSWTYTFKNTAEDLKTGKNLPPPLEEGSRLTLIPAINRSASGFQRRVQGGGVFSAPALVARINKRLGPQPTRR